MLVSWRETFQLFAGLKGSERVDLQLDSHLHYITNEMDSLSKAAAEAAEAAEATAD